MPTFVSPRATIIGAALSITDHMHLTSGAGPGTPLTGTAYTSIPLPDMSDDASDPDNMLYESIEAATWPIALSGGWGQSQNVTGYDEESIAIWWAAHSPGPITWNPGMQPRILTGDLTFTLSTTV